MKNLKNIKGFTLIELLVVIGILAVLLAIVLIAINPAKQFESANNTQRSSDVNSILNAVHQYMADNAGTPPSGIPTGTVGTDDVEISSSDANICAALVPTYIAALPVDPTNGDPIDEAGCTDAAGYATGYEIVQSSTGNRITVTSVQDPTITVTR